MSELKIEYIPDYGNKYQIFRKEYKWLGFSYEWTKISYHDSFEKAEAEIQELRKFPKYYEV